MGGWWDGVYSRVMKKSLFKPLFVSGFVLVAALSAWSRPSNISITASTSQECAFSVLVRADLSDLQTVRLADSSMFLVKTVAVGLPLSAQARVVSVEGRSPMAVAAENYSPSSSSVGQPLVTLSQPKLIRGRRMVFVHVHPVQGMTVYTEVAVRLQFVGGLSVGAGQASPDPVFDRVFGAAVVNSDEWRSWPKLTQAPATKIASADPFGQSSNWVKIKVDQSGLIRITGADLASAGITLSSLSSSSIRIFNAGGRPLDIQNSQPRPTFDEISLLVLDGGDGVFDASDQVIFYGEATNRFIYAAGKTPQYLNNVFCNQNVYWLTTTGTFSSPARRIAQFDVTPTGGSDTTITTFTRRVHAEQDNLLMVEADGINDYYNWYWTDQTSLTAYVPTPAPVSGQTAKLTLIGQTGYGTAGQSYIQASINGTAGLNGNLGPSRCTYETQSLTDGLNRIDLTLAASSIKPYFDYLEISYPSRLTPSGDKLEITLDSLAHRGLIQVSDNYSAGPLLFDLGDPLHPVQLTGFTRQGGLVSFETELNRSLPNQFYCATVSSAVAPVSLAHADVTDLRAELSQADLIILAPQQFQAALAPYVVYRRSQGVSVKLTTVDAIMDNFGFGLYDPTAIRDYLKYQYENASTPAPAAVLMVGDANYDMLDRLGTQAPNHVPSYINSIEGSFLGATYGDDNYVYFGDYGILDSDRSFLRGDRGYDMLSARWPVSSTTDIATIIGKIMTHDAKTDFGAWRSAVTLVADDEFGQSDNNEVWHTTQVEDLEKHHLPRYFTRNKIYLWDYPFVNSEKPAVNEAIIDAFNSGALVVNYVGHGNPDVWAHEHVLRRTEDLPRIHNLDRLPLVFAASCDIGHFNDPMRQSMGEEFLTSPAGGAVAVVSATSLVFSGDNAGFNRTVFDILMYQDSLSIDQAVYAGKLLRQYDGDTIPQRLDNDRSYVFFGDPFLKLGIPALRAVFTERPDSLTALKRTHVAGHITDVSGQTISRNGKLAVTVFDSDRNMSHALAGDPSVITKYAETGPSIYKGEVSITAGNFDFTFIPPVDIGFGGKGAKIRVYAVLDTIDGIGLVDSIPVASQVAAQNDTVGPTISFTIGGRQNFVSGDAVGMTDQIQMTISDSSGINLAGGLGHGITLVVDGRPDKTTNLTGLFAYDAESYTTGKLTYSLTGLEAGEHSFRLQAWDNANNPTIAEFNARLVAGGSVAINDLLNYPNPMQQATTFYFELTQPVDRFVMDIFTLSGRKIKSIIGSNLSADNYPNASFDLVWDGRDDSGDRVATGVYIYKATAVPRDGGPVAESFGKVVVVN
jgi:hypothetical protein